MNDTATKTKNIFSLNLIAYIKMQGLDYTLCSDNNKLFYAMVSDDDDVNNAIAKYKLCSDLQDFLGAYRELREEINSIRNVR